MRRLGFLLLTLASFATPAEAQQTRRYLRFSVGLTQLQRAGNQFPAASALQPTLTLGLALTGAHSIGVAVSYLRSEATEHWTPGYSEAPYTIGVRAIPVEVRYQYRFPLAVGPVRPLAAIGGSWVAVRDTWTSDTPTESSAASVYGLTGAIGLLAELGPQTAIVLRGGYRGVTRASGRPPRHIGLSGFMLDGGVEVHF